MKKILIIHRSLGVGGAEKSIVFLANTLVKQFEVVMLLLEKREITLNIEPDICVIQKDCYSDKPIVGKGMISGLHNLKAMQLAIKEEIDDYNPDLVICFDLRILLCLSFSRINKKKILFSERADPNDNPVYWRVFLSSIYKKIGTVVFQTEGARDFYKNKSLFRSVIIPNAAFSRIQDYAPRHVEKRKSIIFSAGRFQYRKGFDLLISAFANITKDFPDYKLIIYGNGEEEENLKQLINENKLMDTVCLLPPLNNVVYENRDAYLFVLPSRSEGIPNILIEAMMERIPCIASDCSPGGAALLSDNGKYCLLADKNSADSLEKRLRYALQHNKEMEDMATKAQKSMERFDPIAISNMWNEVINNLILD